MKTINVVEIADRGIHAIHAFSNTKAGIAKAKKVFLECCEKVGIKEDFAEEAWEHRCTDTITWRDGGTKMFEEYNIQVVVSQ